MAYKELVKDFNKVRDYMREFYVYGYKSRSEFSYKSKRSYDDERRRIESWLGDHIDDNTDADGKHVYISIDSRITEHNPLYKAWKTKSFTDGDITLHFIIFDILNKPEISLSLSEITDLIDEYLSEFDEPMLFDESTVRKKLKEYSEVGIINIRKEGRKVSYSRNFDMPDTDNSILDFFSEVAPCGVVGSYLLDKNSVIKKNDTIFVYKHHYIQSAMDSEVLYDIFCAIREKRYISIKFLPNDKKDINSEDIVPLKVYISTQSGRQYMMFYSIKYECVRSIRIDNIKSISYGDVCDDFEKYRLLLEAEKDKVWGVSFGTDKELQHVEFTLAYGEDEEYIPQRLEREKRIGTVTYPEKGICKFSADVYDSNELVPWIRTFISRITDISFSKKAVEERFLSDIKKMYELYGLDGDIDVQ